jgi:hypothetical protein
VFYFVINFIYNVTPSIILLKNFLLGLKCIFKLGLIKQHF